MCYLSTVPRIGTIINIGLNSEQPIRAAAAEESHQPGPGTIPSESGTIPSGSGTWWLINAPLN